MNERVCASAGPRAGSRSVENHVVFYKDEFRENLDDLLGPWTDDEYIEVRKDYGDAVYWRWECPEIVESDWRQIGGMGNLQSDSKRGKNPHKGKSKSPARSSKQDDAHKEKEQKSGGKRLGSGGGGGGAVEPASVLVTDSWRHVRRIQEQGPAAVQSAPPSDRSSSPDEVYTEPPEMAAGDPDSSQPFVTTIAPNFTIVKHRKVDLGPTLTDTCLSGILSGMRSLDPYFFCLTFHLINAL